ncbi:hypothetical protein ACIA8F_19400 [Streptomyces sp. NPDC051563]|uniref:hypothetical protein n=1 Tax=Streptomyces sp. NPDC051563 TaxID=3365659 RepID=UPI0037913398
MHTHVDVPGAGAFWRSLAVEISDARTTGQHRGFGTIHFEIPVPARAPAITNPPAVHA